MRVRIVTDGLTSATVDATHFVASGHTRAVYVDDRFAPSVNVDVVADKPRGMAVITKAGGFDDKNALLNCAALLRGPRFGAAA